MEDSGSIPGFLTIHSEVDNVEQNLNVPLRLRCTAHDAKAEEGFSILRDERRNNGMKGAFSGRVGVHTTGFEVEHFAAILQRKAKSSRTYTRAETAVVALDERHHVAVFVSHCEVDGVTMVDGIRQSSGIRLRRHVRVDELPAFVGVLFGNELLNGNCGEIRVRIESSAVFERQFFCFDEQVSVESAAEAGIAKIKGFEKIEHLEGGNSLSVGRELPNVVAAIVD